MFRGVSLSLLQYTAFCFSLFDYVYCSNAYKHIRYCWIMSGRAMNPLHTKSAWCFQDSSGSLAMFASKSDPHRHCTDDEVYLTMHRRTTGFYWTQPTQLDSRGYEPICLSDMDCRLTIRSA